MKIYLVLLAAVAVIASPAHAASTTSTSEALILRPLTLTQTEDLDFGTILPSAVAGTVTVNANTGVRTTTGGVAAAGGTPRRAEFVGAGRLGLLTIIAIGVPPVLTNGSGGTMATALVVEGGTGLRILPGTGIQTYRVGGTLTVGANQAAGDYAGTFTLTVNYL